MKRLVLSEEDCYQSLINFYDYIAGLEGKPSKDVQYDVRKICCTKKVADSIFQFYEDHGYSREQIGALWLCFGPKANLKEDDFAVDLDNDFFMV